MNNGDTNRLRSRAACTYSTADVLVTRASLFRFADDVKVMHIDI